MDLIGHGEDVARSQQSHVAIRIALMSGASDSSKAIGSLAKKQSEVTRQGAQKLKFVPTLPVRRKKEYAPLLDNSAKVLTYPQGNKNRLCLNQWYL